MTKEDSCSECPNATHGFDRNASHNLGRYVCECESHECPSETLRKQVAAHQAEIDRLRMSLADTEALEIGTAERCKIWRESYRVSMLKLAASQLSEKKLREAAERLCDGVTFIFGSNAANGALKGMKEELATPSSTEALDAYVAEKLAAQQAEIERMRLRLDHSDAQSEQLATITRQRDLAAEALIHIQQVACSGSPELGISSDALSAIKGEV